MTTPYAPGQILVDKYEVEKVIGEGGMGVVVAALHLHLRRRVAIKFLLPGMLENEEVVARFLREARAAAMLESEHVAKVSDVGELPDGSPFMVMELLSGMDLATLVEERGPLSVQDAVNYVIQGCEAITEAHRAGIVHRDLKPSNLFLASRNDGTSIVKVLDFGISKVQSTTGSMALTSDGAMMGSPTYMAPEQIKNSKNVDSRVDIWALGVVLHELLTGQPPFEGSSYHEVLSQVLLESPASLSSLRPDVPAEIEAIVLRCLEKDPKKRYPSVTEFAMALRPFADTDVAKMALDRIGRLSCAGEVITVLNGKANIALPTGSTTDVGVTSTSSDAKRPVAKEKSKGVFIGAAVVVLVVLAAGGSAWMMGRQNGAAAGASVESSDEIVKEVKQEVPSAPQPSEAPAEPAVLVVGSASASSAGVEKPAPAAKPAAMPAVTAGATTARQPSTAAQTAPSKTPPPEATQTSSPAPRDTAPAVPPAPTKKSPLDVSIK